MEKYCSPVVFQSENAYPCTGRSMAYAGHTIRQAILRNQSPPTLVFNAMFLFNSLRGSNYELCNYGLPLDDAVVFLNEVGSIPYQIPEIDCQSDINAERTALGAKNRIEGYELLYTWNEEKEQDVNLPIKRTLSEDKPVVCNILTWFPPKDAFKARSYSPSFWCVQDVWEPRASELDWNLSHYAGPHNVVIVGYDDQLYGGALRIMNSYGNVWGDKGFFWIRYSDFFRVANGGFAIY